MVKKLALVTICFASLSGSAMAQDAKTVIAGAKKALGDPTSITYSGSAKDVAFQQCGANCHRYELPGDARSDAADQQLRPRHRSRGAGVASHRRHEQHRGGRLDDRDPGTFFQQVTPQQADVSGPWNQSLELYITPWGFLKGAEANNATATEGRQDYTVLTWSPTVKAPSGKAYTINGYVNDRNQIERVETWVGENIMGDMHIVATYSGWKDFGSAAQQRWCRPHREKPGRRSGPSGLAQQSWHRLPIGRQARPRNRRLPTCDCNRSKPRERPYQSGRLAAGDWPACRGGSCVPRGHKAQFRTHRRHTNLGILLNGLKRPEEAVACYCKVVTLRPKHRQARKQLALAHCTLGDVAEAVKIFEEWLQEEPGDPIAQHMLAACTGRGVPKRASNSLRRGNFRQFRV